MLKLSINELTTFRWTLQEDLDYLSSAGVAGVGVWRQKLSDYDMPEGVARIHESPLQVSSLSWAGGFTGSDGTPHRDSIHDAIEALQTAATLGADCLIVYTGGRGGHTGSHARRLVRSALFQLAQVAEELNVTIALEPMHFACGSNWTFLHSINQTVNWLNDINSPCLKMVFDTYHLAHDDLTSQQIANIIDKVALVQLADSMHEPTDVQNRCRIGMGNLPLETVLHAFQEAGYEGFYEIELMGEDVELIDYARLIDESVQFLDRISDLVG